MDGEASIVLGIDPGTTRMGFGVVVGDGRTLRALDYGVVKTRREGSLADRLEDIYGELIDLIDQHRPDAAVVEKLFFTKNVQTAFAVGQARGVALLALTHRHVPIAEYTPQAIKAAVSGYGKGNKAQIQTMVRMLLNLESIPQPDDAADALAAAICHHNLAARQQRIDTALHR